VFGWGRLRLSRGSSEVVWAGLEVGALRVDVGARGFSRRVAPVLGVLLAGHGRAVSPVGLGARVSRVKESARVGALGVW